MKKQTEIAPCANKSMKAVQNCRNQLSCVQEKDVKVNQKIKQELSSMNIKISELEENIQKQQQHKCFLENMTKKSKIILGVSFCLVLIAIGVSLGLFFRLKPKIIQIKPFTQVGFQDGSALKMTEMIIQDKYLFKPNQKINLIKTQYSIAHERRLLQQQSDFTSTVNLQKQGIILQMSSQSSDVSIMIDPIQFTNYLVATDPEAARILQQIQNSTIQNNQNTQNSPQDWLEIQSQLSKQLSKQLNGKQAVDFQSKNMIGFTLNQQTNQFKLEKNDEKRMRILTQRKLLFGSLFGKVSNLISNIVKPVVQVIKKSGPAIGTATGATIGFMIGGPAGAFQGAKIGYAAGSAAQSIAKACIPNNTLKIKCDTNQLITDAAGMGIRYVVGKVSGVSSWNPFK